MFTSSRSLFLKLVFVGTHKINKVKYRHNSSSRKLLFPLMKTLHPDMFAQESKEIQSMNIECIQNLNALWDCIDTLIEAMLASRKNNSGNVELRNPFRESYKLSCYVRNINGGDTLEESSKSLTKNDYHIKIPPSLCVKCSLSMDDVKQNINSIFIQQGKLFISLGLVDPWSSIKVKSNNSEQDRKSRSNADRQSNEEKRSLKNFHCKLFDRGIVLNSLGHTNSNSMSNLLGESKSVHQKGQTLQKKLKLRSTVAEVDQYIADGKVKVKGVPIHDEITAVERTRQFLVDYGTMLNFGIDSWSNVVLVLLPTQVKPINAKVVINHTARTMQTEDADNNREGFLYQQIKVTEQRCVHVVSMPMNFKPRRLIEYLSARLPVTSIFKTLSSLKS